MKNKNGKLESPGKAKSRIKTFEKNLECGHRLALTYASNQPGEVPKVPSYDPGGQTYGGAMHRHRNTGNYSIGGSDPPYPQKSEKIEPLVAKKFPDYKEVKPITSKAIDVIRGTKKTTEFTGD